MKALSQALDRYRAVGQLALRLVLGGLFVYHGFDKFDAGSVDRLLGIEDSTVASGRGPAREPVTAR